jgi:NADH dehydrogenase
LGEVTAIDFESRYVKTNGSVIAYDYLVLAVGGQTNFFGMNSVEENGFQLKNVESAVNTRNHLLKMFEQANREVDAEKRKAFLTFVVVGGGPTGVETAGALAELITHVLAKDYPHMDLKDVRVLLLEAGNSVMPTYPDELRKATFDLLRSKNVEIRLNAKLTDYNGMQVTLGDGDQINTHTLIWTAGVRGAKLLDSLGVQQAGSGRVRTDACLQVPAHPEVFVIGDAAYFENGKGQPLPMLSTVAIQQEGHSAEHPENPGRSKPRTVSLQGSWFACDDRTQRCSGTHLGTLVQRIHRVADLGLPAYLPVDRFSQPIAGAY